MSNTDNDQQLKGYLEGLLPSGKIEELADIQEGVMRMGAPRSGGSRGQSTELKKAQKAVEKLAIGKDLTAADSFLIEAIIIPDKRPAMLVQDGDFAVSHGDWLHLKSDPVVEDNILKAIPAIGRIEMPNHNSVPYAGTGFLVSDNLIMTNRHVAKMFIDGSGQQGLSFTPGQTAVIDYKEELGTQSSQTMKITKALMIHPYWDMALLEVEDAPAGVDPLMLSLSEPEELAGREIAVIGYPAFDPRGDSSVQNRVFDGVYNVKRLQPGFLKERSLVSGYWEDVNSVTHDASTLGGNSGSAVIDLKTGDVVALHFAGRRRVANYAVPTYELSRDAKVVNTGLEFGEDSLSNIEEPNPYSEAWDFVDRKIETVTANSDNTVVDAKTTSPDGQTTRWTIPITVDISLGKPSVGLGTQAPVPSLSNTPAESLEKMVEPKHDDDYSKRPGYDSDFIGLKVPMPSVTDLDRVSKIDCGNHVLDYHHFSLVMEKTRRLPIVTAANVDTSPNRLKPDPAKKYTRKSLNGFTSRNDREKWFLDPRIPGNHQLPDKFFTKDRKAFDKGHVVRRNAVVWGDSYEEVQLSNGDTFHVTNCTPQVKGFNRSQYSGDWGKLENIVFKQAKSEKLCVLAGPALKSDDPIFSGVDQFGSVQIRIPRAYWKVIAANADGKLQVFAFMLEQDLSDVEFEFQLDAIWKSKQTTIRALEKALDGVVFDKKLHDADQG